MRQHDSTQPARRGQAALEFMTTYGWAIVVIAVVIGAIAYFGVTNPSKFVPNRCDIGAEFSCNDYLLNKTGVYLALQQSSGKTVYVSNFNCTYKDAIYAGNPANANPAIAWGARDRMLLNCSIPGLSSAEGQKVKVTYEITYQKTQTGFNHTSAGSVFAKVQ
jgi:hypothetical protein